MRTVAESAVHQLFGRIRRRAEHTHSALLDQIARLHRLRRRLHLHGAVEAAADTGAGAGELRIHGQQVTTV